MKIIIAVACILLFISCNNQQSENNNNDSIPTSGDTTATTNKVDPAFEEHIHGKDTVDLYANKRFRSVRLEKLNDTSYRITGKAQVWEATLSWVVEDGHNVVKTGYTNTDAGAPEFGNFNFILNIKKKNPHATYMLILFEASANDGSRQHELPIVLH